MALMQASATRYLFELGRADEASERVVAAARGGFVLPYDSLYIQGLARWAENVVSIGDRVSASDLYDRLLPYRAHLVNSGAIVIGSAEMFLGHLAGLLDRTDDAVDHFAKAVERHEAMSAPLFLARSHLYWAEMLIRLGQQEEAADHLRRAAGLAGAHGGVSIERHCAELLAVITP